MERHENADEIRRKSVSVARRYGEGGEESRSSLICERANGQDSDLQAEYSHALTRNIRLVLEIPTNTILHHGGF
jgi:hypothetical protein